MTDYPNWLAILSVVRSHRVHDPWRASTGGLGRKFQSPWWALLDPTFSSVDMQLSEVHTAARATGHELRVLNVSTDTEIDEAFSILVKKSLRGHLGLHRHRFARGEVNELGALTVEEWIAPND